MDATKTQHVFFATAPSGVEPLLAEELSTMGATEISHTRHGVSFSGPLDAAYRACLWSRLAGRVLLTLGTVEALSPDHLYVAMRDIPWHDIVPEGATIAVRADGRTRTLPDTRFTALKAKDAIVDALRAATGQRPDVDKEAPDVLVNIHPHGLAATVGIDLSGAHLHKRGYRRSGGPAPLKENLAAAILVRAGWPEMAKEGRALCDPMCGTGTLLIEGALMAGDIAPGLGRGRFGFQGWRGHDQALWETLLDEARARRDAGRALIPSIRGFDSTKDAIAACRENITRAGLEGIVHVERRPVAYLESFATTAPEEGLVVANPPYGERLGDKRGVRALYETLGRMLTTHLPGWHASIITGDADLGHALGLRAKRYHTMFNGPIQCRLLHFPLLGEAKRAAAPPPPVERLEGGARSVANRIKKNIKKIARWLETSGETCYRVYDADIPEHAVAVDVYGDWIHVQEYRAPPTIDAKKAKVRLDEALVGVRAALQAPREKVVLKTRQRQRGRRQYSRLSDGGDFHEVQEGGHTFLVNLTDYLDTGLFLDHRETRAMIAELAPGKRFLNLFAYTGTATVYAGKAGARATTTVDLSKTYLDWAYRNLDLNGLGGKRHDLIQADCLQWLEQDEETYDLVFVDPPTFSTSKRMATTFDIQRDHVPLIEQVVARLSPKGTIIFSTNAKRFQLDKARLGHLAVEDVTARTIPPDFARTPTIHRCYLITRR